MHLLSFWGDGVSVFRRWLGLACFLGMLAPGSGLCRVPKRLAELHLRGTERGMMTAATTPGTGHSATDWARG